MRREITTRTFRSLTQQEKEHIIILYKEGRSAKSLARELGTARTAIERVLKDAGVYLGKQDNKPVYVPTQEEIAKATQNIRKGYSEKDLARKLRSDWRPVPVQLEPVHFRKTIGKNVGD